LAPRLGRPAVAYGTRLGRCPGGEHDASLRIQVNFASASTAVFDAAQLVDQLLCGQQRVECQRRLHDRSRGRQASLYDNEDLGAVPEGGMLERPSGGSRKMPRTAPRNSSAATRHAEEQARARRRTRRGWRWRKGRWSSYRRAGSDGEPSRDARRLWATTPPMIPSRIGQSHRITSPQA
jgi:hypothetical protein